MFQVGEVSRRLELNPQTLYFYERIGLIPNPQRTAAGYRLYDQADLDRLTFITQAKTLGLSLDDIKELLALQDGQRLSCQEVHDRLLRKMQQLDETIHNLQALKAQLRTYPKSGPQLDCIFMLTNLLPGCQAVGSHP